ncbi:MAG: ribonuclease III [Ruminococcaceae bacterium]|nr:ribonuclease III [Oscillospiraceae bacterium]
MTTNQQTLTLSEYSGAALAYLGDAVMEVLVRQMLVRRGIGNAGKLSAYALNYVRATNQSRGLEGLLPYLTEEENAVYHRGRNAAGAHPKSASVNDYRRATGLEALFGYLHLKGDTARLEELFALYIRCLENTPGGSDHADEEK